MKGRNKLLPEREFRDFAQPPKTLPRTVGRQRYAFDFNVRISELGAPGKVVSIDVLKGTRDGDERSNLACTFLCSLFLNRSPEVIYGCKRAGQRRV
jgi:hypothetical protein